MLISFYLLHQGSSTRSFFEIKPAPENRFIYNGKERAGIEPGEPGKEQGKKKAC
jgi:hypothetical protein